MFLLRAALAATIAITVIAGAAPALASVAPAAKIDAGAPIPAAPGLWYLAPPGITLVVGLSGLTSPRLDGELPWCPTGSLRSVDGDPGHYTIRFEGADSAVRDALVTYGFVCVTEYR